MLSFKNTTTELTYSIEFREFVRGLKTSIPMLLGIIPFALVLGTQAAQKGFSALEVPLLTGLNFAVVLSSPSLKFGRSHLNCCF